MLGVSFRFVQVHASSLFASAQWQHGLLNITPSMPHKLGAITCCLSTKEDLLDRPHHKIFRYGIIKLFTYNET